MNINWITPSGVIVDDYEEQELKDIIIEVEPSDVVVDIISGSLPSGISLYKIRDGRYGLQGVLPIVDENSSYYFTLRASLGDEYLDRYFQINIKNKKVMWDETQSDSFTFSETSYISQQIFIINGSGDETFIKISGELPSGLTLNNRGLLYGIVDEVPEEITYYFKIGVVKNNEIILEKTFNIKVIKLSSLKEPIWITEPGVLGSLNYNDISTLFVKAYDASGLPITYRLGDKGNLPYGLLLNEMTGYIIGQLKTEYSQEWNFDIIASNGMFEIGRDFTISTNVIIDDYDITWKSEPLLGNFKIGENVVIKLEVNSKYPVAYTLVTDTLPAGLILNNKGEIVGNIDYQNIGSKNFIVEVTNGYTTIQREFTIEILKGLGKNAVQSYFYINHEYDYEYKKLLGFFDRNTAYESINPSYNINIYPEIDVCTLNCFDKTLLKHMLYFNRPLSIIWENTKRKNYIKNDEIIYSAFYKSMREESSSESMLNIKGNKVYILPSKESPSGYINEYTKQPVDVYGQIYTEKRDGLRYIIYRNRKTYIEVLNDTRYYEKETLKVVDLNAQIYTEEYVEYEKIYQRNYILKNNNNKCEVLRASNGLLMNSDTDEVLEAYEDTSEILYDEPYIRYYFYENTDTTLALSSTNEIRNILKQKIYVEKNENNNVLYDMGSQEIISENSKYPEFIIYWDEKRKTYYAVYNGERIYLDVYSLSPNEENVKQVYASWERTDIDFDIDGGIAETDSFEDILDAGNASTYIFDEIIDGNNERFILKPVKVYTEYLNTDVDYKNYFIYEKGTNNLQEGIIFTLSWKTDCKFIILDGQVHHIASIDKPWIYKYENNEIIGYTTTIVLPYILDDDVNYDDKLPYIKFFDEAVETIPLWKVREVNNWEPNKSYITNDVFVYNGIYYVVENNFISLDTFDETNMRRMTETEVEEYTKPYYFPSLDLFYGQPNTNLLSLSNLNSEESKSGLWTGRKFVFFELHFKPIYNNNIDNFSVDFYNHKDNRTPEFQLI